MKIKSISILWLLLLAYSFTSMAQQKNVNNNYENNYAYADSLMRATYKASAPGAVLLIAKDGYDLNIKNWIKEGKMIGSGTKAG